MTAFDFANTKLSMQDFRRLGAFIHSQVGIKMPDAKKGMVESRIRKRLVRLQLGSYTDYCNYLFSAEGQQQELTEFINAITTNKTDFFRESRQFDFLVEKALPDLLGRNAAIQSKELSFWSVACSRGHEPYTLAMVLSEFIQTRKDMRFSYSILATDISTKVLNIALRAVYDHEEIEPVPMKLRKKFLLKSKDRQQNQVRIVPELRDRVRFHRVNLMSTRYPMAGQMDVIFCRNVMIYFDRTTQDALLSRLCNHLNPGGYLFVGHSEVFQNKNLPVRAVDTAVYQKL